MNVLEMRAQGLYCPAGDFYIDPWSPVETAVVTHGHSDHATPGHGTYHVTRPTLPIVNHRLRDEAGDFEAHDFGEVFEMGDARVSLHPAGHILGSAQVRVEVGGEVWVVSGDYKRDADPTCAPFEVVPCDTFITEATFALPVYAWEPGNDVARQIHAWWAENAAAGRTSILFSYTLGKAQRLLAELTHFTDRHVWVHGAVEPLTAIYRDAGIAMLETRLVNEVERGHDFSGELVVAPPSAQTPGWLKRFGDHRSAFVSGWMRVRGVKRRRGYDHGFVMSDHADWRGLLQTIRETGAQRVLATHGKTDALVKYLQHEGIDAASLTTFFGEGDDG